MNQIYALSARTTLLVCTFIALFSFGACSMDNHEDELRNAPQITASALPAPNYSLLQVKQKFRASITGNKTMEQVKEDVVFEGVVVANDISGNLYQTLIIRNIASVAGAEDDQCISLGIKSSQLYPYFPLGQRIRINLKHLYIGNNSKTPKVGRPYYTSRGNLRLGPMFLEDVATNIALVGKPNPQSPELTPRDFTNEKGLDWLASRSNKTFLNNPMLVTVRGNVAEVQGSEKNTAATGILSGKTEPLPKLFAPQALYDAGFAVDRHLVLSHPEATSNLNISLRTSVRNPIAFTPIPEGETTYTGVLTYFDAWQLQLRTVQDIRR